MNEYKDKIDKMKWSYSRITCYNHCPYSFYLKYIIDDDTQYLAEGNYYAEVGSYVHSILEKIFNGELKVEDASQYYVDHFDDNVFYTTKQSAMDKAYEACADYFATVDFDWLEDYEILGVEKEINIDLNGYMFIGYIDLLVRNKETNEISVIDHKSSAYPFKKDGKSVLKKSEEDFSKYKKQMYLYCKSVFDEYGEYPKWIVWNHFKDQKIAKIPFVKEDYDEALKWFSDEIEKVENDETFDANLEFFYCTQLCDFRSSCEYANQDE